MTHVCNDKSLAAIWKQIKRQEQRPFEQNHNSCAEGDGPPDKLRAGRKQPRRQRRHRQGNRRNGPVTNQPVEDLVERAGLKWVFVRFLSEAAHVSWCSALEMK